MRGVALTESTVYFSEQKTDKTVGGKHDLESWELFTYSFFSHGKDILEKIVLGFFLSYFSLFFLIPYILFVNAYVKNKEINKSIMYR